MTLDTSLGRSYDPNTFTDEQDSFQIGASIRVPLYQSGEEYARVREYRQTAAQRRRELDQARRDTREDFARGWEQLITARARISSFKASVRANQIALDGVEQEAEVGARTVLDVLDAEQELFDARVNLVRARRDEGVAAFAMLEVTGGMTARVLRSDGSLQPGPRQVAGVRRGLRRRRVVGLRHRGHVRFSRLAVGRPVILVLTLCPSYISDKWVRFAE